MVDQAMKAVFFDHDDTLVATKEAKWAHHKHVAKVFYGRELSDEDILPHWGKPLPQLVGLLYGTDNREEALAKNISCRDDFPKILFSGTIPTLGYLRAQGKLLGVVTATTRNSFEHDLDVLRIPMDYFDYIQTAEDTPYHKPDPRVFDPATRWLEKREINAGDVLYVADGLHDMEAADGAGFRFIGVETGLITHAQFLEQGVESIPNIDALVGKQF